MRSCKSGGSCELSRADKCSSSEHSPQHSRIQWPDHTGDAANSWCECCSPGGPFISVPADPCPCLLPLPVGPSGDLPSPGTCPPPCCCTPSSPPGCTCLPPARDAECRPCVCLPAATPSTWSGRTSPASSWGASPSPVTGPQQPGSRIKSVISASSTSRW